MTASYDDLLREARARVPEAGPTEADARHRGGEAVIVDVREPSEWASGSIPGARLVARSRLEADIEAAVPDPATPLIVVCAAGVRSLLAGRTLQDMGYRDVVSLAGGMTAWQAAGLEIAGPPGLTDAQRRRYSRHLLIPEVGPAGQAKLLASRVLLVGAGGLGSPAALYLAAAGVGTLGIVDFDVVDASNLQRQVLHTTDRVGVKKVDSARQTLGGLNPDVRVETYDELLDAANVGRLIDGYDVIVDGTDSFETRYLLNDAAVIAEIPVVHASVFRFEGQASTFVPYVGPCYRCLYPAPPPPELAPSCSVAGVLGVVPGLMGLLQATEVLKLLLGIGEPLVGRLLLFDALDTELTELRLRRDPGCPVCSDAARAARDAGSPLPLPLPGGGEPGPAGTGAGGITTFTLGGPR